MKIKLLMLKMIVTECFPSLVCTAFSTAGLLSMTQQLKTQLILQACKFYNGDNSETFVILLLLLLVLLWLCWGCWMQWLCASGWVLGPIFLNVVTTSKYAEYGTEEQVLWPHIWHIRSTILKCNSEHLLLRVSFSCSRPPFTKHGMLQI